MSAAAGCRSMSSCVWPLSEPSDSPASVVLLRMIAAVCARRRALLLEIAALTAANQSRESAENRTGEYTGDSRQQTA